jgi:hypothetical protein
MLADLAERLLEHCASLDSAPSAWGWKEPRSIYLLPFLARHLPHLRFLHVVRDGRDMALSGNQNQLVKHGDVAPIPTDLPAPLRSMALWGWINLETARFGENALGERYLRIRFEDLCAEPVEVTRTIFDFLGLTGDPRLAVEEVRPPGSLGGWRSEEPSTVAELERVGGEALAALRYDLSERSGGAPRRTASPAVRKLGVFVLGMHRSGTSAATRLVNLLGVETCVASDLLPWARDNPRGHWESRSLNVFNDRILATLGWDWTCPGRLRAGWESNPALARLEDEAPDAFERVFPTSQWVWKDPRNCLTLPFWARCLDVEPVVVLVHRNPLEIAASLADREGFTKPVALALWERYLRTCLDSLSARRVLVTDYVDIVADPLGWSSGVREFLAASRVVTEPSPDQEARAFVSKGLRNVSFTTTQVLTDHDVSAAQRELHLALGAMRGAHERLAVPHLPRETPTTDARLAERRAAYAFERRCAELAQGTAVLDERIVRLEATVRGLEESVR